ncbi:SAM-dependent methyltransferase [Paenibacillus anaericanus]|uniref:SAM-dependent methyltransferase n=1 Tax=Paenibacillus anaericanus TaxID=170367 RepID=A0A433Y720_9BACL|nr:class I SAM-dependent methyltransferase [Paenibacillus anaericanus]RUT45245.1 SAM-dependent methyltransferase [Paenibacillus anaericanus]
MEFTNKFTGKATIYSKYRSSYPMAYIDYLINRNGLTNTHTLADIGSGTGILTKQLLDQNLKVIAIEPNNDMRISAEDELNHYEQFTSLNAAAENTGLPNSSVDLITVAQAFHWFDKDKFKLECQRILKQDANVALVWNSKVSSSDLVLENAEICRKHCSAFVGFSGGIEETPEMFQHFFRNGTYEYKEFENHLEYDLNSFIGRNLSSSYAPKETDDSYSHFIQSLSELYYKYSKNNVLIMPNLTRSYIGQV